MIDNIHESIAVGARGPIEVAGWKVGVGVFEGRFEEVVEFVEDVGHVVCVGVVVWRLLVVGWMGMGMEWDDEPRNITRRVFPMMSCWRVGHSGIASLLGGV